MHTISGFRLPRRLRRRTGVAVAALTATAVVSGLTAAPVASLPPSPECPMAYPLADLDRGDRVDGLTVSSGRNPEGFTGEILGVINDGIAPGLDMIMAELTSDEIDRVGIWQGMSGSPVYAKDGRLIGAVAYGLAWGPSPVAGITPAEEMYRLLEDAPTVPAAAEALAVAEGAETVDIPLVMAQRMAATGTATEEEAEEGLSRLLLPLGISGMSTSKRLRQAKKAFDLSGVRVYRSGSVTTDGEPIPVEAGGNLAASLAYGDLTYAAVGTVTARARGLVERGVALRRELQQPGHFVGVDVVKAGGRVEGLSAPLGGAVVAGAALEGAASPEVALGSVEGTELLFSVPLVSVFVAAGCGTPFVSAFDGCDVFSADGLVLDAAGFTPAFATGPFFAVSDSSRVIFDSDLNLCL